MDGNRPDDLEVEVLYEDRWVPGRLDPTTWRKQDGRWVASVRFQSAPQQNQLDAFGQDRIRPLRA